MSLSVCLSVCIRASVPLCECIECVSVCVYNCLCVCVSSVCLSVCISVFVCVCHRNFVQNKNFFYNLESQNFKFQIIFTIKIFFKIIFLENFCIFQP